jgi:hypothetical protein
VHEVAVQLEGVVWHLDRAEEPSLGPHLARLVRDVDAGRLQNQKSGRRKELYAVELEERGAHLLKVNRYPGASGWWRRLRGSKARREQRIAREIARRGLPVPLSIAWGERARGRLEACYLLVPRLAEVVDLSALESDRTLSHASRRALASAFGALSRRVHDAGLQQDDFAPNNFLVRLTPQPELFVIDFERARLRAGAVPHEQRVSALARLDRRLPGVSNPERWRFLVAYAGDSEAARSWWRELAAVAPRVAARDLARLRRTTTREGRRVRRVRAGAISGWARRETDLDALLAAGDKGHAGAWRRHYVDDHRRRGRDLWAAAHLLWLRGLGARPLALLRDTHGTALWLACEDGARDLDQAREDAGIGPAATRLLGRLLALGSLDPGLERHEIAVIGNDPAHLRAVLLAPERLRIGHAPAPVDRLREARRLAQRFIAINP